MTPALKDISATIVGRHFPSQKILLDFFAFFIYLQSLGKAFASTAISLIREVVFGVGFAFLLPQWFGLDGVLYSMPVSDVLTFVICLVVIYRTTVF